jgi:hypothetical protein
MTVLPDTTAQSASAQTSADASGASANSAAAPAQQKDAMETGGSAPAPRKKFVSHGYRVHNEITYRVIDWLLNSTVGVAATYVAARTEAGQKYFQKPVSKLFEKVLSPILKDPKSLAEGAKWGTAFTSIMAGGFAIIPLVMVMENKERKKKIIRWFDEKIYGKDTVENDPKFKQSYQKIDEEPKKGFWTGMTARLIAIAPLITVASLPATNKPLMKYLYNPIGNLSKRLAAKIGITPGKMLVEGAMEHPGGDPKLPKQFQSNWDFLHQTIGFDFGLTIFYAILHETAYKALAAVRAKKHASSGEEAGAQQAPAAQNSTASLPSEENRRTPENGGSWIEKTGAARPRPQKSESYVAGIDKSRVAAGEQPAIGP